MKVRLIPSPAFDPFAADPTRRPTTDESSLVRVDAFELVGGSTHQFLWSARQVSTALGYQQANAVADKVGSDWAGEFVEGTDFVVLSGDDLQGPKDAGTVGRNAPSAMFLTESGVHLVALLSRQSSARALRRWLADEVLPSLRRTGSYGSPDPKAAIRIATGLRLSGDKAGAVQLLRRLAGLPELPPEPEPAPEPVFDDTAWFQQLMECVPSGPFSAADLAKITGGNPLHIGLELRKSVGRSTRTGRVLVRHPTTTRNKALRYALVP